jgi:hypothetical protein
MDVENPKLALADVPKAVKHSGRCGNPCSWTSMDDVIAEPELSLSLKNVERISVIPVAVDVDAESGAKLKLDDFEFGQLGEDSMVTRTTGDLLSLVGGNVDAGHPLSISSGSRLAAALCVVDSSVRVLR